MTQYLESYKKNIAIALRRKGSSLSDIKNSLGIPKSTLSFWLKRITLTPEQKKILKERRVLTAKKNSARRTEKTSKMIEQIKTVSSKAIQNISPRELWLMGIILYWRSQSKSNLQKGVSYSSSDPHLVKLFLKWLSDIGKITDEEIDFDIFTSKKKNSSREDIIAYWSKITGWPKGFFSHIYIQNSNSSQIGFLRIRVKASTMLARQISGWIKGIQQYYWGNWDDFSKGTSQ